MAFALTLDELFDDPLALHRDRLDSLALPDNLPQLREFLDSIHEDVVEMAASLIGVLGDPDSVTALVDAFRRFPGSKVLQALLECGPQGRRCLASLVAEESFLLNARAWDALVVGLQRPAIRPAIFQIMQELAANEKALKHYRFWAAEKLVQHGWISSWRSLEPLLGQEIIDNLFEGEVSARFPAPKSAAQEIAGPYRARVQRNFMQQLEAEAQRTRDFTHLYESEIEKRRVEDRPIRASTGRNQACPCGSGKKYKKCCLAKDEERGRLDPWVLAHDRLDWSPIGLQSLPMEAVDSQRLLQILLEDKPGHLKVDPQDSAVAAWLIALRWLQIRDWPRALGAVRFALQEAEPKGLDLGATLTTLFAKVQLEKAWDQIDTILQIWGERALDCHMWMIGESLAQDSNELLLLLDRLVARKAPLPQLLAMAEGALKSGADWILAEELVENIELHYFQEPQFEPIIAEWLEHVPLRQGYEQAFPYPHPRWIDSLPHLQRCQNLPLESIPEAERLLFRLEQLSVWPDANATVTEDSLEPLSVEFEARRQLQAQTLDKLYNLLSEHQQRTLAEIALDSTLVVALTCEEAIWFMPPLASLEESSEIAATAQSLSAHLKLGRVEVANWRGRFALRQAYQACHPENLAKALDLLGTKRSLLPLGGLFFEGSSVTFPEVSKPPAGQSEGVEAGLPVSIKADPNPVRKTLRKVLRRLFRNNNVGGSYNTEELASRGVPTWLQGPVAECLELLVHRGILEERLTLMGQETLIHYKQIHKVLSFIEQGWLPHPDLAQPTGDG